ncbi:MAG: helix-turn-helix transcriptional regulator [Bacillota bacterium]
MGKTGSLIRRLRTERRLSQKALCRGICAVSYLSKIEKGTANPGEEIIRLLFQALGVEFQMDEAFLRGTRQALDAYFEHAAYLEPNDAERERLLSVRDQALRSPLTDSYTLFLAYNALEEEEDPKKVAELLNSLRYREAEMDERDLFFYVLAHGMLACDADKGLAWHQKANRLRPCGLVAYQMGKCYHLHGAYQAAIDHLQTAYTRAADEGSPIILLLSSNLTAICYSDLYQKDLMLQYFRQARRLARRIEPQMIPQIDYNIGATLVSMRKSADALPYLKKAEEGGYGADLLLYHKLAIACFDIGDLQAAKKYLRKADVLLKAGKGTPMEEKMIRIVRFRLMKNYLALEEYYTLLREVYDEIGQVYHHGFRQFHGNLLIEACVHNRRYKEALHIAAEVEIFPEFIE